MTQRLRYRTATHLDTKTWDPVYGVQVRSATQPWANAASHGEPCLFDTKVEADMFVDFLRLSEPDFD
jgi:hypothetical protein